MKKLSIVLALIMALSCLGLVASAANVNVSLNAVDKNGTALGTSTYVQAEGVVKEADVLAKAAKIAGYEAVSVKYNGAILTSVDITGVEAPAFTVVYAAVPTIKITIHFISAFVNGEDDISADQTYHEKVYPDAVLNFTAKIGTTLTAADILANVKDSEKIDTKEFVLSETVFKNNVKFKSEVLAGDTAYAYDVYAAEINDVNNFAQVAASEVAGYNWGAVANANVTVINQIINGLKAAIASLCEADWPECSTKAEASTAEVDPPATGASAVAGAAIVVLALSAATAVVLRKKED